MNVRFLTLAQQEVDEAFIWFDERTGSKGLEFLDEFDRVVRRRQLSELKQRFNSSTVPSSISCYVKLDPVITS